MSKDLKKNLYYLSTFMGELRKRSNQNASVVLTTKSGDLQFVSFIESVLQKSNIGFDKWTTGFNTMFSTRPHPSLGTIYDRVLVNGRVVIDPHMLTLLDAESFGIIVTALGMFDQGKETYILNTRDFSYGDNFIMKKTIKEVLDLEFNVKRVGKQWQMVLRKTDIQKFDDLFSEFKYKLGRQAPV